MKGPYKFCPETGARLSEEKHYSDGGRSSRAPVIEHDWMQPTGNLTNGSRRSSTIALLNYFRRTYRIEHDVDEEPPEIVRAAALAIRRLKKKDAWDDWIWYALAERLHQKGYDVEWMLLWVEPPCPRCNGPMRWEETIASDQGVRPRCASDCSGDGFYRDQEIVDTITTIYNRAFEDPIQRPEMI